MPSIPSRYNTADITLFNIFSACLIYLDFDKRFEAFLEKFNQVKLFYNLISIKSYRK